MKLYVKILLHSFIVHKCQVYKKLRWSSPVPQFIYSNKINPASYEVAAVVSCTVNYDLIQTMTKSTPKTRRFTIQSLYSIGKSKKINSSLYSFNNTFSGVTTHE